MRRVDRHEANTMQARWNDRLGIFLSGLCMVHCALTPLAILAIPALGLDFIRHGFHFWIAFLIAGAALAAFIPGFRTHGQGAIFAWALPGFALIVAGTTIGESFDHSRVAFTVETVLSLIGGACLIRAHLLNRRLCECCHIVSAKDLVAQSQPD